MITESSIEVEAPAPVVWEVFTNVEHWPDWTASVERVEPLDGPELQLGRRFRIKQPRFPQLVWEVTSIDPGVSWTWQVRSPGATTLATHELTSEGPARTLVRQRIDQRGPLGIAVGVLSRRLTTRYLDLEAKGLKATSERRHHGDAA